MERHRAPLDRRIYLSADGDVVEAVVQVESAIRQVWRIGEAQVVAERIGEAWQIDGQPAPAVAVAGGVVTVFDDYGISFEGVDPLNRDSSAGGDGNLIVAPMPGLVKAVFAEPGQAVREGDRLAVLEAMKMEHSLLAARDGVVAEVLADAGAQVEAGAALVRLEEEG